MSMRIIRVLITAAILAIAAMPVVRADDGATQVYTVAAIAFQDNNLDGMHGLEPRNAEPGLATVRLDLYLDWAPLKTFGPEDKLVFTQTTNDDGFAVFRNLAAGAYLLKAETPRGAVATTAIPQIVALHGEASGAVIMWSFGFASASRMPMRTYLPMAGR
jgi:hypothetical protein